MRSARREEVLEAFLLELGESGRDGICPDAVLAGLGVSAEEFAQEFGDLDSCLESAYADLTARLEDAVRAGCADAAGAGPGSRWPRRVRGGLEALLSELADEPRLTRALVLGYPALGSAAQDRYRAFVERVGSLMADGRRYPGVAAELPAAVETLAVGAAEAIVFEEVVSGRTRGLPALSPAVLFSLLVPFLGPAAAAAEMEEARHA